jgi:hypothetical protein
MAYQKETKNWKTPEERYFFAVWEGGAMLTFHIFIA